MIINFQDRFLADIKNCRKKQTARKTSRNITAGDTLDFYEGSRFKPDTYKNFGRAHCVDVIQIKPNNIGDYKSLGFKSKEEMLGFYKDLYGKDNLNENFQKITWELSEVVLKCGDQRPERLFRKGAWGELGGKRVRIMPVWHRAGKKFLNKQHSNQRDNEQVGCVPETWKPLLPPEQDHS